MDSRLILSFHLFQNGFGELEGKLTDLYVTGDTPSTSSMTLAMTCDDGSSTSGNLHSSSSSAWLEDKKARKARQITRPNDAEALAKELDEFIDSPCEPEDTNPFQWWATNQLKFPHVADVARAHLGIPATSVASERVFSKCGLVCSDRRTSLKPQHVEHLVFLSHNLADD